jgi:ketosteroid isomerase-like protein
MIRNIQVLIIFCLVISCRTDQTRDMEKWKKEVEDTERAFSAMASENGIPAAFLAFAADDVTLLRGNVLIKGKEALKKSFDERFKSGREKLTWAPDFVDVSDSGDMAYTYGKYVFTSTDSLGNKTTQEGIFHTVWKRQGDGKWKFVWD